MRRPRCAPPGVLAAAWSLSVPYAGFNGEVFLDIARGSSSRAIARDLERAGVIRGEWQLLLARLVRRSAKIQAGEYLFRGPASVCQVLDRLSRGDVYYDELRVPEGWSKFDIAEAVESFGVMSGTEFLSAAGDPSPIRDLAPGAPSLEGYLFPSTYRISRHTTAGELCRLMTEGFRRAWRGMGRPDADVHRVVTLASLVEKETGVGRERPVIASVFTNRLRIGMPLQCDPTTIYSALIEGRYRGAIRRSDLDRDHPYNTYQHAGLPPGPSPTRVWSR